MRTWCSVKYVVTDSEEVPRGVKSMERESRGWLPRAEGGEHGRVSVWEDEKVLEMDGGDG